jgi:HEAT repeat protein
MVAVESLGCFEDRRLTEALLAQLQDPDPELRGKVVEVLDRLGDARAIHGLTALLEDPDPGVRRLAATALGNLEVGGDLSA